MTYMLGIARAAAERADRAMRVLNITNLAEHVGSDVEALRDVLELYQRSLAEEVAVLTDACRRKDVPAVRASAHGIRGSSSYIGGERFLVLNLSIEKAGERGDWVAVESDLSQLLAAKAEFDVELETLRSGAFGSASVDSLPSE